VRHVHDVRINDVQLSDSRQRQAMQRPGSDASDAHDDDSSVTEPVLELSGGSRKVLEGRDELFEQETLTGVPRVARPFLSPAEKALAPEEFEALVHDLHVILSRCRECGAKFSD